tara:strand:+ start:788 stop:1375 length:588 start_codon:yes stop_codon:yes gene_type:complete
MRILISILVLIFSFQSLSKADDIRDFEIEGISIGDSALNYFNEEELISTKIYYWSNKKFASSSGWLKNKSNYEGWQIFYKDKDKKFIIHYISGLSKIKNLEQCNKKKNEVVKIIKKSVPNAKFIDLGKVSHPGDKTGKSLAYKVKFNFKDGSNIMVTCNDYTDTYINKMNNTISDNFNVAISSSEFINFLNKDAY